MNPKNKIKLRNPVVNPNETDGNSLTDSEMYDSNNNECEMCLDSTCK